MNPRTTQADEDWDDEDSPIPPRRQRRRYLYVLAGAVIAFFVGMNVLMLITALAWSLAWRT
jgi:hypothetical protein